MNTKICTKCLTEKPLTEFQRNKANKDGLQYWCKECLNACYTTRYHNNPVFKASRIANSCRGNRHKRTGWTPEQYDKTYAAQKGNCKICGKFCKNLCADHDHEIGKIRELLCKDCNTALGLFQDSPFILTTALYYLIRHS